MPYAPGMLGHELARSGYTKKQWGELTNRPIGKEFLGITIDVEIEDGYITVTTKLPIGQPVGIYDGR